MARKDDDDGSGYGLTGSIGALGRKAQCLHAEDTRDRDAKDMIISMGGQEG